MKVNKNQKESFSNTNWDASKMGGSIKRNIVNPDLLEERKKCIFDQQELSKWMMGEYAGTVLSHFNEVKQKYPQIMESSFEEYEMTRRELAEVYMKRYKVLNDEG